MDRLYHSFQNVIARTAAMTGLSERTVNRIVLEGKAAENSSTSRTEVPSQAAQDAFTSTACAETSISEARSSEPKSVKFVTPGKQKKKITFTDLDEFDLCVIRRIVMYM